MNAKITALDALIEAVEAGRLSEVPFELSQMRRELWDPIVKANSGFLDAAKALHDAMLPWWGYRVSPSYAIVMHPRLSVPAVEKDATSQENPARAWLLAILRAYRAQIGGVE